jgi:hypothetical protein
MCFYGLTDEYVYVYVYVYVKLREILFHFTLHGMIAVPAVPCTACRPWSRRAMIAR